MSTDSFDGGPTTIQHVRMELSDPAGLLDETLLTYHLGRAEQYVESEAADTIRETDSEYQAAVAIEAAYRFVSSDLDSFTERFEELDIQENIDVETYLENLRARRDEAINAVQSGGPWSVTVSGDGVDLLR